jgi:hypothetical protein
VADIFVSYTSDDRDWAFWIGQELLKLGHAARDAVLSYPTPVARFAPTSKRSHLGALRYLANVAARVSNDASLPQ